MKKIEHKLWIRDLSCGHSRHTNIAFISKDHTRPKVGNNTYCRECCKEVKIIKVRQASKEDIKELKKIIKKSDKL